MTPALLTTSRKKSMKFMLMPLVDVIFLLLTFFMLSSNLSPFSSLMLGELRREAEGGAAAPGPAEARPDLIVTVLHGEVRANGRALVPTALPAEAERLRGEGAESAVVFVRPSATAQDVVTVLEALKHAAFAHVSVRTRQVAR
jgi:biopolymer transport protein ExbD